MNRKQVGALVMALGGLVLLIGGLLRALDSGVEVSTASTATSQATTIATSLASTAAPTTSSTVATSTVPSTTTSTTAPSTTTTVPPTALVAAFIEEFAAALEAGDTEFVFSRLHPAIVLGFGEELCSGWVNAEIMALTDYSLDGPVTGPTTGSLETPTGDAVFDQRYTAPVTFTFSGASFSSNADFVILDGVVYFTGTCR